MKKNFWVDMFMFMFMFISGLICIITGIMLDFHLIPGGRAAHKIYRDFHIYSGYIMAVLILVHMVLHSKWISNSFKKVILKR